MLERQVIQVRLVQLEEQEQLDPQVKQVKQVRLERQVLKDTKAVAVWSILIQQV
jgi:hypothetical protein